MSAVMTRRLLKRRTVVPEIVAEAEPLGLARAIPAASNIEVCIGEELEARLCKGSHVLPTNGR